MLDMSKVFDRAYLLSKLALFGFCPDVVSWVSCFLNRGTISFRVCGVLSQPFFVNAGVPQGPIIGFIVFTVVISDPALSSHPSHSSAGDNTLCCSFSYSAARQTITYIGHDFTVLNALLASNLAQLSVWGSTSHVCFHHFRTSLLSVSFKLKF